MMLNVTYRKTTLRVLRRMQPKMAQRIQAKINEIADDPDQQRSDVKSLTNRSGYRLRVGDWRIIFTMDETTLDVLVIGPRGDVYK